MNFLATYIMRNRTSAVLVAVASAVLSLLLPPLSYLSGAVAGLVTLRHGGREGLIVLGIAGLLIALPALFSGSSGLVVIFGAVVWMPVWVLAVVLRQTVSLPATIIVAASFGVISVAVIHGVLVDPTEWWRGKLEMLRPILTEAGWKPADVEANLTTLASAMTAMLAAAVMMTPLISLFIARWWQALLYNPGGWRKEFQQLRLPATLVWVAVVIVTIAWFTGGSVQAFAADLLIVILLLYLLQGLSVIHNLVNCRGLSVAWLVGLYALLLILPQAVMLVAGLGFTDTWLDYRSRLNVDTDSS
ncbi:MAG TPA: DUF2232 domain-containing protein [Gammaproteobacteria bacterium]|nr:DUF2232 domain-containing protein [Gammaproteobacteria bacterium]